MKRKTTNLVIVLLSFLIAALIALAVFMTWFTKEQTAFLESLRDAKTNILCRIHLIPQTLLTILSPLPVITFFLSEIPERSAWRKPCRIPMMRIPALI